MALLVIELSALFRCSMLIYKADIFTVQTEAGNWCGCRWKRLDSYLQNRNLSKSLRAPAGQRSWQCAKWTDSKILVNYVASKRRLLLSQSLLKLLQPVGLCKDRAAPRLHCFIMAWREEPAGVSPLFQGSGRQLQVEMTIFDMVNQQESALRNKVNT